MATWWAEAETGRADRRVRKRQRPELAVESACVQYLQLCGYAVWSTAQPFRPAIHAGLADLIALKPGAPVLFVECKAAQGRVSRPQRLFLTLAQQAGAVAIVAHSAAELADQLAPPGADAAGE